MLSPDATLIDVAFAVCTALDHAGERALLVGGSAATFYAPDAYQSSDCDFILALGPDAEMLLRRRSQSDFIVLAKASFVMPI